MSLVSIIIPSRHLKRQKNPRRFFSKVTSLPDLVESIRKNFQVPYEVIVVCNGEEDPRLARYVKEARIEKYAICNLNAGVARAWNIGRQLSEGDCLLFLNDDVVVGGSNVESFLEVMRRDEKAGVVGRQGGMWKNGEHWYFTGEERIEVADAISGYAFAVLAKVFDEVGGFDVAYTPAGFEEIDFCFAVKSKGYRNYVVPQAEFVTEPLHGISAIGGRINYFRNDIHCDELHRRNKEYFLSKWGRTDAS